MRATAFPRCRLRPLHTIRVECCSDDAPATFENSSYDYYIKVVVEGLGMQDLGRRECYNNKGTGELVSGGFE